jgi:hypothetical protein
MKDFEETKRQSLMRHKRQPSLTIHKNYDLWILLIIPGGVLYWFALDYLNDLDSEFLASLIFLTFTIAGLYSIVQWWNGYKSKCPKCKNWFVRRSDGQKDFSSHTYNSTKTVSDVVRNSKGEQIGTIDRSVPVTYEKSSWTEKWRCVNCSHDWETRHSSTSEV